MQAGTHMGKILIKMPEDTSSLPCTVSNPVVSFRPDASYLLVGGLGGLGKAIALWMVERGARHLVFFSRSASDSHSQEHRAFLEELEGQGCTSSLVNGDVAKLEDVQRAVSESQSHSRPLAGVLHLSMVLHDQLFAKIPFSLWEATLAPKVQGTWNLHQALLGLDRLDFFVLFGSQVGITGNYGQSNYTAANCFVNAFARYRRQQGLPCSVIHLGPVEEVGLVSRDERVLQHARDYFIRLVQQHELMDSLCVAITQSPVDASQPTACCSVVVGLGSSIPTTDPRSQIIWGDDARFGIYYGIEGGKELKTLSQNDRVKALVARVEADPNLLDDPKTERELTVELGRQITEHMPSAADMDEDQLANMPIDSLMSIEIKSGVRRNLGIDVSLAEISRAKTIRGLSKLTISHLKKKYQERYADDEAANEKREDRGAGVKEEGKSYAGEEETGRVGCGGGEKGDSTTA